MALAQSYTNRRTGGSRIDPHLCLLLSLLVLFVLGCATTPPPRHLDDVCDIFTESKKWYQATRKSFEKWGIPIHIQMALLHQESKFEADARPPRTSCLWIFPGPRQSSAYGYAQAKDETWDEYRKSTGRGGADRDDFADAVDFVGWYCSLSNSRNGISKRDAYNLYLAYHEGHGGYSRKTYLKKDWLVKVARKVEARARRYEDQLASCERDFRRRGSCLWPF